MVKMIPQDQIEHIREAIREDKSMVDALIYGLERFDSLLQGITPAGHKVPIYSIDYVREERVRDVFGTYAVWMPLEQAKEARAANLRKQDFTDNDLVLTRAGTKKYLSNLYRKHCDGDGRIFSREFFADSPGGQDVSKPSANLISIEKNGRIDMYFAYGHANYVIINMEERQ